MKYMDTQIVYKNVYKYYLIRVWNIKCTRRKKKYGASNQLT